MSPAAATHDPRPAAADPTDRLLPWTKVRDLTGISRTTAWRLQKAGDFPPPVVISPGRVGWRESELEAWKASRAPRSAAAAPAQRSFLPLDEPPPRPEPAPPPRRTAAPPGKAARRKPPENGQLALDF